MSETEQRLPDVWIDEGDALLRSGFRTPDLEAEPIEEALPDLHGLTHDQLVFIGLAETRAVELLKAAGGSALEALRADTPPSDAFVDANPAAAAGNAVLRAMTFDLFVDPKAEAVERLTARANAELAAEADFSDYELAQQ